jgi:hypothetical protein
MSRLALALVVGAVFLATFVVGEVVSISSRPKTPQEIQAELEKDVAEVRKTLPKEEGDVVTWFDVEAQWQTIVYKYKIHAPRELVVQKKKELEAQMKNNMMLGAAKMMMPKGVKMKHELYDGGGSYIYTLDLD